MMERMCRQRPTWASRGQAAVLMTVTMIPLMGLLGLVIDIGWAYWRKEACKTAAEAAAFASAMAASTAANFNCKPAGALPCPSSQPCPPNPDKPPGDNIGNACLYARQNGFVNSGKQSVTISANTTGIPVAGVSPSYWVSATVSESIPQLFSAVLGNRWAKVRARGTAAIFQGPAGACIYSLDPTGNSALDFVGNSTVESSCGVYVNSNSGSAMTIGGNATLNASTIRIVGNYSTHGHPVLNPDPPSTGQALTPDPFASVPAPNYPDRCDSTSGIPNGSFSMPADGYYVVCDGGFGMTGNPNVTLPAGTYVLKGGSIDLHNGTLRATGGVTFYLTGNFSGVTINGNVDLDLSAPTSGPLRGLLFYQDRSLPVGAFSSKINGTSNTILNGSLYFPTTRIEYSGGSDTTASYTALIAWDISFKGNSYLTADLNGGHTGLGVPKVALVE
jgi:hypothetical protein